MKEQGPYDSEMPIPVLKAWAGVSKWTRFCWWLSRKLGGAKVFGKQDFTK